MLRKLAIIAGIIAALIASLVALGLFLNHRATTRAESLCSEIRAGMNESTAVALGRSKDARYVSSPDKHEFRFQGWVFNAVSCTFTVKDGKVALTTLIQLPD